jgi:YD repeat-containing protein
VSVQPACKTFALCTSIYYDIDGQLILNINHEGTTSYSYDIYGNLKEDNTKVFYIYNANNQIKKVSLVKSNYSFSYI